MAKGSVFVTGIKELDRKFAKVAPTVQKKVARKGLRKAAKLIQQDAKANIERHGLEDTEQLKRGLKVRAAKRSRSSIGVEVFTTQHAEDFNRKKGFAFGGAPHEFGTKHTPARSFLRPAGYDNDAEIELLIINSVNDALDELTVKK